MLQYRTAIAVFRVAPGFSALLQVSISQVSDFSFTKCGIMIDSSKTSLTKFLCHVCTVNCVTGHVYFNLSTWNIPCAALSHTVCGPFSYSQGLLAVVSRGGMIKVSGAAGVEMILEEEGSIAGENPPAHLLFPTPNLLVGVTATGGILVWELAQGHRCGYLPPQLSSTGFEEHVTAVHSPHRPCSTIVPTAAGAAGASSNDEERYVFLGFESGCVRVIQVLPVCRVSGYVVEPHDTASGAPEELLAPSGSGQCLGAVTSITTSRDREDGGIALFGHQHGGIVLWDWVRRKRLSVRGVTRCGGVEESETNGNRMGEDREVTTLAFHPSGEAFAAGFASGCYALFSVSSSNDPVPPRWVHEVGDDGTYPREGPTIVRTAVSLVEWVSIRGAEVRAWGLLVAGGIEMEEGEEPDGVSLLVPPSSSGGRAGLSPSVSERVKKKVVIAAALAVLETAVFVPFAIGQERLSHVHSVILVDDDEEILTRNRGHAGQDTPKSSEVLSPTGTSEGWGSRSEKDAREKRKAYAARIVGMSEELVVLGLVTWKEEVRGSDGHLHFRRTSSIKACPVQTSPYVALLQLAPERIAPHLSGFAPVTSVASTPLFSSSTILDFMSCLQGGAEMSKGGRNSRLLRGGCLGWPDSVSQRARDDALCTSEMLVVGHSDGQLSFWECCGPASRQDGISISEGRVIMRDVPSGTVLLGSLPAAELAGSKGIDITVTALDVWIERDHIAAAERNACWVAVGFGSGEAAVLVLSSKMEVGVRYLGGGGVGVESGGGTPLVEKPVEVSNVELKDNTIEGGSSDSGRWKLFAGRGYSEASAGKGEFEDAELEAAIAAARAEARAIAAQEGSNVEDGERGRALDSSTTATEMEEEVIAREKVGKGGTTDQRKKSLREELSEAMAEEGTWGDPIVSISASKPSIDVSMEREGKQEERSIPRKASLVQLALRLHGHAVRCVVLSYDTCASALALVVADEEGVVSVTDISTGSASLLPVRAPQTRPCRPSVTVGPLPSALCMATVRTGQELGVSGALFVFLDGWLNVFDLASRDPIDLVEVPAIPPDGGHDGGGYDTTGIPLSGGRLQHEENQTTWLYCVDEFGVPLVPYASEPLSSLIPSTDQGQSDKKKRGGIAKGNSRGKDSGEEWCSQVIRAKTIWVSPSASRTTLDGYHEHELQVLSGAPPPKSFLLLVSGALVVVLSIANRDTGAASPFSRRSTISPDTAAFKGRSDAELVVKSRVKLPSPEGGGLPLRVDRAGVCMLAAKSGAEGKSGIRGCLLTTDASGLVTGLLLPSLSPVFRDRISVDLDQAGSRGEGTMPAQKSVCNLVGELTIEGPAGVSGRNVTGVSSFVCCWRFRMGDLGCTVRQRCG